MKNKLRIAVTVISASAMFAFFFAACGGNLTPTVQLAQVTGITLTPADGGYPGVSKAGSISFDLYLQGNQLFLQTPVVNVLWSVQGLDRDGHPAELHMGTVLNTVDTPMVGHAHRNPDLDLIYDANNPGHGKTHDSTRQVILNVYRGEESEYIIVTAVTNLPGGAGNNMSDSLRLSVADVLGVVGSVNLQSAGLSNAHRSSDGPLTGLFQFTTNWTTFPSTYDVPIANRDFATWSITHGASYPGPHGPGASINAYTGALTIPRGQAPGILTIRAASRFDNEQYATITFVVNTPVVNAMTLHGVPAQGNEVSLARGSTIANIRVDVDGFGYPQDLPRDIRWDINQSGTDAHTQIAAQQNSRYATFFASFWEIQNLLTLRATDLAGATFSVNSGEINLTGAARIGAFVYVSVGDYHILARGWDGSLWSWGRNQFGQLGHNDTIDRSFPTEVESGSTDWEQVSAGHHHSHAIRTGGTLWSWGFAGRGSLGLGPGQSLGTGQTPTGPVTLGSAAPGAIDANRPHNVHAPRQVQFPYATGWTSVSAGGSWGVAAHYSTVSLALRDDGRIFSWGTNAWAQGGTGGRTAAHNVLWPTPRHASAAPTGTWTSITAGRTSSAAGIINGNLYTWGSSRVGEGGRGVIAATDGSYNNPARITNPMLSWTSVSAGYNFMVGVDSYGRMWSWGSNADGRLGRTAGVAVGANSAVPGLVQFPQGYDPRFTNLGVTLSQGAGHVLAIDDEWRLWSWGRNHAGQLGRGANPGNTAVPAIVMPGTQWRSTSAGANFSLAVALNALNPDEDGLIWTWGNNQFGQMGQGQTGPNQTTPLRNPFNRTN